MIMYHPIEFCSIGSAVYQYCCSQQSTLCQTRLPHGGWSWQREGKNKDEQNLQTGHFDCLMSLSSQSETKNLPLSSDCMHQLCRLKLKFRRPSSVTCITSCSKLTPKTSSSSEETSAQKWGKTLNCGKEFHVDIERATAMTRGACFWSSFLSINLSSPTPYSSRRIGWRQHEGTHAPNTGISWTTP